MANKLLEAALEYAARGWPLFPCRADKTPMTKNGTLDATTDPAIIEAWWSKWPRANIGFDLGGAGMMVLDLDPGYNWSELEANCGPIPDTALIQKTPRGGEHLFFELDPGEVVSPSSSKLATAVDVRSFHSYVLLYPSRTDDGEYSWAEQGRAARRSDEMVRVANSHREKSTGRDTWIIEPDLPENIDAAIEWLQKEAKIAIEGQGGEAVAYATAAMMKSYGISEAMAFDLMWEHWNPRCCPPWSSDEVDHFETKIRNGYSYNTSNPGNMTSAYRAAQTAALFKPVERPLPEGRELTQAGFRFVDRAGMASIQPPKWLIPNLIPEGAYAILLGHSGTFKSFIALDLGLSVATGLDVPWVSPDCLVEAPRPVLCAIGEGRPGFTARVLAWEKENHESVPVNNFVLADPVPLAGMEDARLDAFIDGALAMSPGGYALAIVDTTGRAMQGLNENQAEDASKFTRMVQILQKELNCAVLAISHTGVGDAKRERGSTVFGADADTRLLLERNEKNLLIQMTMLKQKDAPEWERPKKILLQKVEIGEGLSSLVPTVPQTVSAAALNAANENEKAEAKQSILQAKIHDDIIDRKAREIMGKIAGKTWTQAELAEDLQRAFALDQLDYESGTLENRMREIRKRNPESFLFKSWKRSGKQNYS